MTLHTRRMKFYTDGKIGCVSKKQQNPPNTHIQTK